MTNREFSDEFDVLLNSHPIVEAMSVEGKLSLLEFNEYEKSIFLTKALEYYIVKLYKGPVPSFETTEEYRRYLSNLVSTETLDTPIEYELVVTKKSKVFQLPKDMLFITYELVKLDDKKAGCLDGSTMLVVPIRLDELYRVLENPFRRPNKHRVLRLDLENNMVEILSKYNIAYYQVRYLKRPTPIILEDLPDGLKVNGIKEKTECELNPILHKPILDLAVSLALLSRITSARMYNGGGSDKE